ncbi:MAG: acetate/propionate family kinase [Desulfuromonadales bacterium]
MFILTLNCWSYSVRYHLFDWHRRVLLARGQVDRVAVGGTTVTHHVPGRPTQVSGQECADHRQALALILHLLSDVDQGVLQEGERLGAISHRVAHGGDRFTRSVQIDGEVLATIKDLRRLAPLHNEPNIAGIEAAIALLPDVPQIAVFDTAFHQTLSPTAFIYPLPYEWYEKHRLRRYGFHGPSHLYMSKRAAVRLGKEPGECNLITIHVDRGVSLCAIRQGISVDTSMGMTPLEGAIMGTRCGDIDAGILPYVMTRGGYSPREMDSILNLECGLRGITGRFSERGDVLAAVVDGDERCELALAMETYRLRKYIGAYMSALGGVDAIVFTSGAGDLEWMSRQRILRDMEFFGIHLDVQRNRSAVAMPGETTITRDDSPVKVFVVPANEERVFAEDAAAILAGTYADHLSYPYSFTRP